jgi:hypothetical protein
MSRDTKQYRKALRSLGLIINLEEEQRVAKRANDVMQDSWQAHCNEFGVSHEPLNRITPIMVRFMLDALDAEIGFGNLLAE